MVVFLTNGFSPSMLKLEKGVQINVIFNEIGHDKFCEEIRSVKDILNAIGHKSTVELVNSMCGVKLEVNRISITADKGDTILMIILTVRLEEGRILKDDEIKEFLEQGKIKFVKAKIK